MISYFSVHVNFTLLYIESLNIGKTFVTIYGREKEIIIQASWISDHSNIIGNEIAEKVAKIEYITH